MGKKPPFIRFIGYYIPAGNFPQCLEAAPLCRRLCPGGPASSVPWHTGERHFSHCPKIPPVPALAGGYWAAAGALPTSWLLTVQGRHLYALLEKACPPFGSVFCFLMGFVGAVSSWCLPHRCCWRDLCATATKELSGYRCHLNVRQVLYYCIFALHNHTVDF